MRTQIARYIPNGCVMFAQEPELGLEVYVNAESNIAIGFAGKRSKSDFYMRYRSAESMNANIAQYIENIKANAARVIARREQQKEARRNAQVKVGDVFRSSWGYDQTNVDYFQVVAVKGQTLTVREIGADRDESGFMSGQCTPVPSGFIGEPMIKRLSVSGTRPCFKVNSCANAYFLEPKEVVNGKPVYESTYYSYYA